MKTSDFIKRLNVRFDVYSLKKDWWNLEDSGALKTMISPKCKQIGLTHTKDCKEDTKWSQGVGSLYWDENYGFIEKDFSVVNIQLKELCPYWWEVCNEMKSKFSIGRIRIMIMNPNSVYPTHKDHERRWHIPIIAPRNSFYYIRTNETTILSDDILESSHGVGFHMPDSGFVYETENSHWHTAVNSDSQGNKDSQDRVHMLFNEAIN